VRAMLASTIQKSNNKKPTSHHQKTAPLRGLMLQTPNSVLENQPRPMPATVPRRPRPKTELQY